MVRHEVAVIARRKPPDKALEVIVSGYSRHVEHLHGLESRQVEAHHLAEVSTVMIRQEVAAIARRKPAVEVPEVIVTGYIRYVQHRWSIR